jgi:glycosyltransferase involved in cell wall biosynthesis
MQNADACVAVARNEMEHFEAYGVAPERVTLIPNGVDPAEFASVDDAGFRRKFGLSDAPFILFLGRLDPIKGPDLLLDAFAKVASAIADLQIVFAGPDGGMQGTLESSAHHYGVAERTHFIGPIRGADKSHACHAACLLAISSRQEAMSIVVLEAGICGTPVLITDQCGFNELAASGGGMVVPASADGLEEGLREMLDTQSRLPGMGARLREFTHEHFLWEKIVGRYLQLFSQLARQGKSR